MWPKVMALLAVGALAACSGGENFDSWVGQDQNALMNHFGTPVSNKSLDGGGSELTYFASPSEGDLVPFARPARAPQCRRPGPHTTATDNRGTQRPGRTSPAAYGCRNLLCRVQHG